MVLRRFLATLSDHQRSWFVTGELGVPRDVSSTMWKIHYVTFASLFTLLMLFITMNVITLVQDNLTKKFMKRNHFLWVNIPLLYFCIMTALPFFIDPYERRRHMRPRATRQAVHLVIRLRLPCLSLAFLLVHVSLLNITEIRLHATRFSNAILIYTLSIIHFTLILISTASTMFAGSYVIVWLLCDVYTCALFLMYAGVSSYTGAKILLHYHRDINVFRKVITSTISQYEQDNSAFENDDMAKIIVPTGNDPQNVQDIEAGVPPLEVMPQSSGKDIADERIFKQNDHQTESDKSDIMNSNGFDYDNGNPYNDMFTDFPKRGSQFPIYREKRKSRKRIDHGMEKQKVICESRSIGSMPYQSHSSKFADKSLVKVVVLTVVVSSCQLLLSIGMVVALLSAVWFDGHNIQGWQWYLLRTFLRAFELGSVGSMAYLVRRSCCCW